MIKIVKILFITLFLLSFGSFSFAENKISFIDVNYIFINSDAGKKINKEIKKKNEKINNEL